MNRTDLQLLADMRVDDARVLLAAGRFDAAYYLAGYAVECALKACIAKRIHEFDFPDKKLANDSYVHDLQKLLRVSGIENSLEEELAKSKAFDANWVFVKDWSEESRYEHSVFEQVARKFFAAVTDPENGVLPWLKRYY